MLLDLTHIRQAETDLVRAFEPAVFAGRDDAFRTASTVDLSVRIHKDQDRFRLVGTVAATLELRCGRCLEPFAWPVEAAFDVRYLPQSANAGDEEREIDEDDLSTSFYRDEQIDLGQLIEEQFYLALPMKPLCRADCRGLCPQCGTDWNVETCACDEKWEDPRLAGLKALIIERKKDDA
ncbi:MAG: DUF177 domain-containing protein [Acidobacteriota bacterium]